MIRRLKVLDPADSNTVAIASKIAKNSLAASIRFLHSVRQDYELLLQFPGSGQQMDRIPKRLAGLRFLPVRRYRKYLILYIPREESIDVLRIVHGARNLRKVTRETKNDI